MQISNDDIEIVLSVKLLEITIDDRLNFNEHISVFVNLLQIN